MSIPKTVLASVSLAVLIAPSHAQTVNDVVRQLNPIGAMMDKGNAGPQIRVQVSYQLQLPGTQALSAEEQMQAVGSSHELIYKLAAHECEHLQAIASGGCRLISVNVGKVNVPYGVQAGTSQITGNAVFELTPKAAAESGSTPAGQAGAKPAP